MTHNKAEVQAADLKWIDMYKMGAISSILVPIMTFMAIVVFFIWPYQPGYTSIENIFKTLHNDRFAGLMSLDLLMVVIMIINIPQFLALYVSLKKVNESYALLALILGLFSLLLILAVRPISEMCFLSEQYFQATTELEKFQYLAAGEAIGALFKGTAWLIYIILFGISYCISSVLMLRTTYFTKMTAYLGIISVIGGIGNYIPKLQVIALMITTIIWAIWSILVAKAFYQLGWKTEIK